MRLKPTAARRLIFGALTGAGTSTANARYLTEAVLDTELSGLDGHGFYWLKYYCAHVKSGKVKGRVKPLVKRLSPVSFKVDARGGFAHPAFEAGFQKLIPAARKYGIAGMSVYNSYSAATLGFHTGYLAKRGLLAFGFANAMPALAPVGGRKAIVGTNPLSFAVPGKAGKPVFIVDQSSSAATWTAVKRAAEAGRSIPSGWAVDEKGRPTTDARKGLQGSIAPVGGAKGFGLALMVEVMCAALAGALRGPEMGSFTAQDGRMIGCGQFFIAIDPRMFAGGIFAKQVNAIARSVTSQKGARLPNARRVASAKKLAKIGIPIDKELHDHLLTYVKRE